MPGFPKLFIRNDNLIKYSNYNYNLLLLLLLLLYIIKHDLMRSIIVK